MTRMLRIYAATLKDRLLPCPRSERYWQFYDWADGLDGTEDNDCTKPGVVNGDRFDAPLNFLYILALQATANMAHWLSEKGVASQCLDEAQSLRSAAHGAFWDAQVGAYRTYLDDCGQRRHLGELTQALAILGGVGDDAARRQLREKLMNERNGMTPTTLSQSLYKFEAILLSDEDRCARFVRDRITADWSRMLYAGATSFWETLRGGWDFSHAGSMCHGWSGIPVYFFGAYGLGIKPLSPGMSRVAVKPRMGMLSVEGVVPTPRGPMKIQLERGKNSYSAQVQVPPATELAVDSARVSVAIR
jgi:alpha-L-rhamnosidase